MKSYFDHFNYSLANEDNFLEINIAKIAKSKSILAIAGSGNRSLFLSSTFPDNLVIIDTSSAQINYCQYKEGLVRESTLDHYWQVLNESLLYEGKYEKTLITFSKIIKLLVGSKNVKKLFSFDTHEEQKEYYQKHFPRKRFHLALHLIGNPFVMNKLLYKGSFVKKNIPLSHGRYYIQRLEEIIQRFLLKEHFFAQLLLLGEIIFPQAKICENTPDVYHQTQAWLKDHRPLYLQKTITEITLKDLPCKINLVSYSNVPSYYQGKLEQSHMQQLKKILESHALVIVRYYLRIPENIDLTGYLDVTDQFEKVIAKEKVNMYDIKVYQFVS